MDNSISSDINNYSPVSVEFGFADDLAAAALVSKVYAKKTDFESVRTGKTNDTEPEEKVELDIGDKTLIKKHAGDSDKLFTPSTKNKTEEDKLLDQIQENIYLDQFNQNDYIWICQQTLKGDLEAFNKLSKGKQAEFLVKLYRTSDPMSNEVIEAVLPYVQMASLEFTFRFGTIDSLGDAKKLSFLKRLASESSRSADQLTIQLLLGTDETMIANCPLDTLLQLRKKEYLGQRYQEILLLKNDGAPLSKGQFQQLSKLSAKITTICFTYFLESAESLYERSNKENLAFTRKDLNGIRGLYKEEKDSIYSGFVQKGLVSVAQQPLLTSSNDQVKRNIHEIIESALEIAADYMASIKET